MKHKKLKLNTLQKVMTYLDIDLPQLSDAGATPAETYAYTRKLLEKLGNPEHGISTVHVAGTIGKGTVSYLIDAMLRAHDQRTALCVSPHVYDARERIQINGQLAPERQFVRLVNTVVGAAHEIVNDHPINYFGILMAISLLGASQQRLDYVIVEAGLGGKYDQTNLIEDSKKTAVIAQIGNDKLSEQGVLAEARDTAATITDDDLVVALKQDAQAEAVIRSTAKEHNAKLNWVQRTGVYQNDDFDLACETARQIANRDGWHFDEERARLAADMTYIPGRYEKRDVHRVLTVLDGAHNPRSLNALAHRLQADGYNPINVLFAIGHNKDIKRSLEMIKPICKQLFVTEYFTKKGYRTKQAASAKSVAATAKSLGISVASHSPDTHHQFIQATRGGEPLLITGSFYLLSEVDRYF